MNVEFLEEDNDAKACISCEHRWLKKRVVNGEDHSYDFCEIDNHYIGYVECWTQTCEHHKLIKVELL